MPYVKPPKELYKKPPPALINPGVTKPMTTTDSPRRSSMPAGTRRGRR